MKKPTVVLCVGILEAYYPNLTKMLSSLEEKGFAFICFDRYEDALSQIETGLKYDLCVVRSVFDKNESRIIEMASKKVNPRAPVIVKENNRHLGEPSNEKNWERSFSSFLSLKYINTTKNDPFVTILS